MKKYMIMCMAIVALLFASCKKEDISISREVTFNVNPYDVISGFVPHEQYAGDLSKLFTGQKLRVRVMVYDKNGNLKEFEEKELENYNSSTNVNFTLDDDSYTVVATTSVVKSDGTEYWKFEKMDHLSDFQIIDNGKVGERDKILGIGHIGISIGAGNDSFDIPMQPAGALIESRVVGWSDWQNLISFYWLMTKKTSSNCSFNADGSYNTFIEERTDYTIIQDVIEQGSGYGFYSYTFALPYGMCDFRWEISLTDGEDLAFDDMTLNIESGKMYLFHLDMENLVYYYVEMGSSKSLPPYKGEEITVKPSKFGFSKQRIED